ncbi:hypothetical protein C8R46DRAFT_1233527 [Mycena filopes]|nr:hypothetical protein C8R46DRAFT_1233527 [Mycena filopes]
MSTCATRGRSALHASARLAHKFPPSRISEQTQISRLRICEPRLNIQLPLVAAIGQANRYRKYVIYGDTPGGIERRWQHQRFRSAADVWAHVHRASYDLINASWYFGDRDAVADCQQRVVSLRILACALEAQGDQSCSNSAMRASAH